MDLTKKDVNYLVSRYDIGPLADYKQFEKGVANYNWLINTDNGKFVLRCVNQWKKTRDIKFELKYLEYFRKRFHYEIPQAIRNLNRSPVTKYKGRLFWMYPLIKGEPVEKYGKKELKEVAKLMAEYHNILIKSKLNNRKIKTQIINPSILRDLEKQKRNCLSKRKKRENEKIFLSSVDDLLGIYKSLNVKEYFSFRFYPIHRDINPENVLFNHGKAIGLIDFDNVSIYNEPLIKDVVILLMYSCRDKNDKRKINFKMARYFLGEYQKYRKLTLREIKLIPILATSNAIEDFSYVQWLFEHEPKRAKLYRLRLYSDISKWFYDNRELIVRKLTKA